MLRLMKIFEWLWLAVSLIALTLAITRAFGGQSYGNYIYITLFTAGIAVFMYWFKRRNRLYLEKREKELNRQSPDSVKE